MNFGKEQISSDACSQDAALFAVAHAFMPTTIRNYQLQIVSHNSPREQS
ncbi:MAG: hypothetical protein VKL59_22705 [Nostocaceae cyanobacterium]|nr:hypothetical protein [Nostocaceae cyanobacterium]